MLIAIFQPCKGIIMLKMKNLSYLLSLVVLVGGMALIGCGDDDPGGPTIEEQQLSAIVGTWSATGGVTLGGNEAPGDWSNFTITFTNAKGVSVSGDPTSEVDIFSVSTFDFSNENTTNIGLTFGPDAASAQVVSASNIILTFTLEEGGSLGTRTSSVAGNWSFNLTK